MANHRPPRRGGQTPARGPKQGRPAQRRTPVPARPAVEESGAQERLQKVLAHAGIGSRRACEEVILQGRVTVDGQVVRELGTKVDPRRSQVAVDGQKIQLERMVYYAVNKPKGYVSTNHDPAGRPRVVDLLPEIPQRVYTVGRLDEMSTGLMLLTNDGELANKLAHPKFGVEKLYRAVVAGEPSRDVLNKLTEGVWLAEGKVRAKRVRPVARKGEATVLELVLAEGKNREVRRMLAKLGHKVMSLTRVAVGPILVKGLSPGSFRPLSSQEVDLLRKVAAGIAVAPRFPDRKPRPAGRPKGPRAGAPSGPRGRRDQGPPPVAAGDRPRSVQSGPQGGGPRRHASGPPRPKGHAHQRPSGAGRPGAGSAPRPAGAGRGSAPPPRVVRPEGPPPSQRRAAPPKPEPTGRRIIGMAPEGGQEPARRPKPRPLKGKRPFPRASLGPRRPRRTDGDQE